MKLSDLTKRISTMSEAELLAHVEGIRHNKYVARPAKAKREEEVEKKVTRKRTSEIDKLLDSMSDEDKAALLKQLGIEGE